MTDSGGPFLGMASLTDATSQFNVIQFIARMMALKTWTGIPVLVKAVRDGGGGAIALAGVVDVQPMIHQVDGNGAPTPHDVIFGVPYLRIQGGSNAVVIDPQVGDIGWCLFAQRDISTVKANKVPSTPGSSRTFDPADGFYLGGLLNGVPEQYVTFTDEGITVLSPTKVTVQAPDIELVGDTIVTGTLNVTEDATMQANLQVDGTTTGIGDGTFNGTSVHTHIHSGVTGGSSDTGPPV